MINRSETSGHAPGDLRDRFIELIESGEVSEELTALARGLKDCTDTVPAATCSWLDEPAGSTYAQLARRIRSPK